MRQLLGLYSEAAPTGQRWERAACSAAVPVSLVTNSFAVCLPLILSTCLGPICEFWEWPKGRQRGFTGSLPKIMPGCKISDSWIVLGVSILDLQRSLPKSYKKYSRILSSLVKNHYNKGTSLRSKKSLLNGLILLLPTILLLVWRAQLPPKATAIVQFSSVTQSCLTLCNPMDCSAPGFSVHHQLLEFTQTHVHWVSDAIQPSHPLSSPSPPAFNLSQHQGLFKWVSSLHQVAKVLEFQLQHQSFQWISRTDFL